MPHPTLYPFLQMVGPSEMLQVPNLGNLPITKIRPPSTFAGSDSFYPSPIRYLPDPIRHQPNMIPVR
ncbi:hypothetical protein DSO57_1035747 [Entomophthora muscae]|uniref:Uncharacterized protein n=1 Tax=Entomophthora muscae TaxID=34485 RepID=A0ACC2RE51_9FUNG|nr:hypothetical protein DSO57_1035747 [Entomophthora muscae]